MPGVTPTPAAKQAARTMLRAGFTEAARAWEVHQRRATSPLPSNAWEDFEDWFTSMRDGEVPL